jgi:hypothetical protein
VKLVDDQSSGDRKSDPKPLLKLVHSSAGKNSIPAFDHAIEDRFFLDNESIETILDAVRNMIAADAEVAKGVRKAAKASGTSVIYEREIGEAGKQLHRNLREVTKLREEFEAFWGALVAATTRMVEAAGTLNDARNAQMAAFLRARNGQ